MTENETHDGEPVAPREPDQPAAEQPDHTGEPRQPARRKKAGTSARKPAGTPRGGAKKPGGAAGKTGGGKAGSGKTGSGKTGSGKTGGGKAGSGKTGGRPTTTGGTARRRTTGDRSAKAASPATEPHREPAEQTAVTASLPVPLEPAVESAVNEPAVEGAVHEPEADAGPAEGGPPATTGRAGSTLARALAPAGRALTSHRAPRLRTAVAAFLVVASTLAVLVSTLALWSRSIVFDTDAYVRVVAPVAQDPQARRDVSEYVAARAVQAARLEERVEDALPADAKVLAPALTVSLQGFLADEIDAFLGTELARRLWVDINRFTHAQLVSALQDENRYLTVGRNDVELDLLPLIAVALQKLDDEIPRLLGRDVALPEIDPDTPSADIRILLQDALGRELPADFGTVTLLRGSQGWEAKQALRLFNDLVVLVVVLTAVLMTAAVLVSVRRLRTAAWLGLGALLAFVAARVIAAQLEKAVTDAVGSQGGGAVARSVLESAVRSLNGFFVWVAVAGAVVAVAAFLAERPAWLERIGDAVARLFGVASDLPTPDTRAGRWMAAHLDVLRAGGVGVAVVALLFATASLTAVLLIVMALVVYQLALAAYAAGVPRESGGRAAEEPPAPPPA